MEKFKNILDSKYYDKPSVFKPENLLREGRRQKGISKGVVPSICILDPDGDIVRYLKKREKVSANGFWACYHTELFNFTFEGVEYVIIGNAVGGSFAVLLAEQLFVSGCKLLINITSAGVISDSMDLPRFLIIEKALRDEGTSYHYLPPAPYAYINASVLDSLRNATKPIDNKEIGFGTSWTTDAPYRETAETIDYMKESGNDCVEMESAALYAFAQVKKVKILCIAHLTNTMAQNEGDFEKGEEFGSIDSIKAIHFIAGKLEAV